MVIEKHGPQFRLNVVHFGFFQIGDTPNSELRSLSSLFGQVIYRGQSADLRQLSLHALLPETDHYMTYEGSTTHPGCWETTSWIVFNKPIYISRQEVRDPAPGFLTLPLITCSLLIIAV